MHGPFNFFNSPTVDISYAFAGFDLSLLNGAASLVDARIELLERHVQQSQDPDGEDIYDRIEYLSGFGLVACQAFLSDSIAVAKLARREPLERGPRHSCGESIAYLVNALANYWKHSSEWEAQLSRRAEETAETIASLGVNLDEPYVVINALSALLRPRQPRVIFVVPFLSQWRDALRSDA